MGQHQRERFALPTKQADLVHRKDGRWFLLVTVEAPDVVPIQPNGTIGVDLGVTHLAVTDDGEVFSGERVDACRRKYNRIRRTCQRAGTKSARRKLHRTRKKEGRFRANENHVIAKRIVSKAKGTASAIALENLEGIGGRITVRKADRSRMKGWAFCQLRNFITYKAALAGIPVVAVDPRNTSRTCSECGHCEKGNRKTRDHFECRRCEYCAPADWNAARNIRDRGEVMRPNVGAADAGGRIPEEATDKPVSASPRLRAWGS